MAAAAGVAWGALCAHPPDASRGRALLVALQKARTQLEAQLGGRVEDAALLHLWQQHQALCTWQQQLNPRGAQQGAAAQGKAPPPGFKAPAAATGGLPAVPALSAEDAVLAVCGMDADMAAEAYAAAASGGAAGGTAAAFAAAMQAPRNSGPSIATAAEAAAVEAEGFGAKGRMLNAEAGARWLVHWCSRATGGAAAGDDTVPTAVCRLLLSGESGRRRSRCGCHHSNLPACLAARAQPIPACLLPSCRPQRR